MLNFPKRIIFVGFPSYSYGQKLRVVKLRMVRCFSLWNQAESLCGEGVNGSFQTLLDSDGIIRTPVGKDLFLEGEEGEVIGSSQNSCTRCNSPLYAICYIGKFWYTGQN